MSKVFVGNMLQELDRLIGACEFHLNKAQDKRDLDAFNHWFAQRSLYLHERAELLNIRIGSWGM